MSPRFRKEAATIAMALSLVTASRSPAPTLWETVITRTFLDVTAPRRPMTAPEPDKLGRVDAPRRGLVDPSLDKVFPDKALADKAPAGKSIDPKQLVPAPVGGPGPGSGVGNGAGSGGVGMGRDTASDARVSPPEPDFARRPSPARAPEPDMFRGRALPPVASGSTTTGTGTSVVEHLGSGHGNGVDPAASPEGMLDSTAPGGGGSAKGAPEAVEEFAVPDPDEGLLQQTVEALEKGQVSPQEAIALLKDLKGQASDPAVVAEVDKAIRMLSSLPKGSEGVVSGGGASGVAVSPPTAKLATAPPTGLPSPAGGTPEKGGAQGTAQSSGSGKAPGAGSLGAVLAKGKSSLDPFLDSADPKKPWKAVRLAAGRSSGLLSRLAQLLSSVAARARGGDVLPADVEEVGWFGPPRARASHSAPRGPASVATASRLAPYAPMLLWASAVFWTLPFWLIVFRRRRRRAPVHEPSPPLDISDLSRVIALYDELDGLSPEGRAAALADAAKRDPALAARVGTLLRHPSAIASFLEEPAMQQLNEHVAGASVSGLPSGLRLDDYILQRELGRGGIAAVYLARQVSLDRNVALKISPLLLGGEARLLAQLEHENIVKVYAEAVDRDRGWRLVAMQLISGTGLERLLAALNETGSEPAGTDVLAALDVLAPNAPHDARLLQERELIAALDPIAWIASTGAQLADALHAAHERKILHLDVKPSNILLSPSGRPYLTDFNVSVIGAGTAVAARPRGGTSGYMSPEQRQFFEGTVVDEDTAPVDARSDIYSLAVVLAEMLATYRGSGALRRRLEILLERCLDVDRDRRPATAFEMADELRRIAADGDSA